MIRRHKGPLATATATILGPAAVGLAALCVVLIYVRTLGDKIDPANLREHEQALLDFWIILRGWSSIRLPIFLLAMAGCLALAYALPQSRALTRMLALRGQVQALLIGLTALLSFSFFANIPLDEFGEKTQAKLTELATDQVAQFQIAVRTDWQHVGEALAAQALKSDVHAMTSDDRQALQTLLRTVADETSTTVNPLRAVDEPARHDKLSHATFPGPGRHLRIEDILLQDMQRNVIQRIAQEQVHRVMPNAAQSDQRLAAAVDSESVEIRGEAENIGQPPRTPGDWLEKVRKLQSLEQRVQDEQGMAAKSEAFAKQMTEALKEAFAEAVGTGVPEIGGLLGLYVEEVVGESAKWVVDRILMDDPQASRARAMEMPPPRLPVGPTGEHLLSASTWETDLPPVTEIERQMRLEISRELEERQKEIRVDAKDLTRELQRSRMREVEVPRAEIP